MAKQIETKPGRFTTAVPNVSGQPSSIEESVQPTAQVPNMAVEAEVEFVDDGDDHKETAVSMPPINEITAAMADVARGGSMASLREIVARVCPPDKDKAQTFLDQIKRLRDAGEGVHRLVFEQVSFLASK